MNHECQSKIFSHFNNLQPRVDILAVTYATQDMHVTLRPFLPGYLVPGYVVPGCVVPGCVVWQAGCSKVPACAFSPGKEASDNGYFRGSTIGLGEGGTNVGKGLLIADISVAEVV